MRQIFWLSILLLLVNPCGWTAPAYGTRMPKEKGFSLGLQTHYVFKRYLENEQGSLRSAQEFLLLSYGLKDWLSIDLKGGMGFIKQRPRDRSELDYSSYLGGGYGFRVRLWEKKGWTAVWGFQHISIHPHTISLQGDKHKAVLDDWQFSALVSYRFPFFVPYLGGKWSRMDYIHWVNGQRNRVRSDLTKSWGIIAGLDFALSDRVWLNLEGQALDSLAGAFSINYSF